MNPGGTLIEMGRACLKLHIHSPYGSGQVGYTLVDFIELYDLGTPTPTPTFTATETFTPSNTPTITPTPFVYIDTPTPTSSPTAEDTPTFTQTNTPTGDPAGTETQTFTPSFTPSNTPTNTSLVSETATPTGGSGQQSLTDTPTPYEQAPIFTATPTATVAPPATHTPTATNTNPPINTPTDAPGECHVDRPLNDQHWTYFATPDHIGPRPSQTSTPTVVATWYTQSSLNILEVSFNGGGGLAEVISKAYPETAFNGTRYRIDLGLWPTSLAEWNAVQSTFESGGLAIAIDLIPKTSTVCPMPTSPAGMRLLNEFWTDRTAAPFFTTDDPLVGAHYLRFYAWIEPNPEGTSSSFWKRKQNPKPVLQAGGGGPVFGLSSVAICPITDTPTVTNTPVDTDTPAPTSTPTETGTPQPTQLHLGGTLYTGTDTRRFRVYVPTKNNGTLSVTVGGGDFPGVIIGPDGEYVYSGDEIGENSQGWYEFQVGPTGDMFLPVRAMFTQQRTAMKTPWTCSWYPMSDELSPNLYDSDGGLFKYDSAYGTRARAIEKGNYLFGGGHYVAKNTLVESDAERTIGYDINNADGDGNPWTGWEANYAYDFCNDLKLPGADGDTNDTQDVSWYGHCDMETAVVIRETKPTGTKAVNGVSFGAEDRKGLLVCLYHDFLKVFKKGPDVLPDEWQHYLEDTLVKHGLMVGCDVYNDPNVEYDDVWNHPIYSTTMKYTQEPGETLKVTVDCVCKYWVDGAETIYYLYDVTYDADGNPAASSPSDWKLHPNHLADPAGRRPDTIWFPEKQTSVSAHWAGELDYDDIRTIVGN